MTTAEQSTPLTGYRTLSPSDADMINRWKGLEIQVAQLFATTYEYSGVDRGALGRAVDTFRDAFMWTVRSIAQPGDVYAAALAHAVAQRD